MGLLHTEKKRREGRKKNLLHKEDKFAILAVIVVRSKLYSKLFLKFWLVTH